MIHLRLAANHKFEKSFLCISPVKIFLSAILVLASCTFKPSEKRSENQSQNNSQNSSLTPELTAATNSGGTIDQANTSSLAVPFPHPANFKDLDQHGVRALGKGFNSCKNCHGSDGSGGTSGVSCTQCHKQYPHSKSMSTEHGLIWRSSLAENSDGSQQPECLACHNQAVNLNLIKDFGASAPQPCSFCHSNFPHDKNWLNKNTAEFHGLASLRSGSGTCLKCHEKNPSATDVEAKQADRGQCQSCHPAYPHEKNIANSHGTLLKADSSSDTDTKIYGCLACHGQEASLRTEVTNKIPSCQSCHTIYPHPKNFTVPGSESFHGALVKKNSTTSLECVKCHKDSSLLANDKTTLVPKQTTKADQTLSGVQGDLAPACQTCHQNFPHNDQWTKPAQHGKAYLKNAGSCLTCHQDQDGSVNSFCHRCHEFPHEAQFNLKTKHPMVVFRHNIEAGQCAMCHNESKRALLQLDTCESCHNREWPSKNK